MAYDRAVKYLESENLLDKKVSVKNIAVRDDICLFFFAKDRTDYGRLRDTWDRIIKGENITYYEALRTFKDKLS